MVARVERITRVGTMNTEVEAPHTQVSFSYGKEQTAWLHSDSFSLRETHMGAAGSRASSQHNAIHACNISTFISIQ